MKKTVIKIIKRYKEAAVEKIVAAPEVSDNRAVIKNNVAEREMAGTIGGWISERRENRRAEEVSALRQIAAWKHNSEIFWQS